MGEVAYYVYLVAGPTAQWALVANSATLGLVLVDGGDGDGPDPLCPGAVVKLSGRMVTVGPARSAREWQLSHCLVGSGCQRQ